MVGVTGPECGLDPAGPHGEQSCHVSCVVDMYGPADLANWKDVAALRKSRTEAPELYKQFSVLTHLDKTDPQFLILHGTADTTVDLEQSKILDAALSKAGIEHQIRNHRGRAAHVSSQPKQQDLRPLVLAFFERAPARWKITVICLCSDLHSSTSHSRPHENPTRHRSLVASTLTLASPPPNRPGRSPKRKKKSLSRRAGFIMRATCSRQDAPDGDHAADGFDTRQARHGAQRCDRAV